MNADQPVDVSVIICTYNRCASLRQTLQTCCQLAVPAGLRWELLVTDNNSNDATKQVCDEFSNRLPLVYIFESRPGKSQALNSSVAKARGELLLFTDDDVDLEPQWIAIYWAAAQRYPTAAFFGGKIIPRWEIPPPPWMAKHSLDLLSVVTVHLDYGDTETNATLSEGFAGANLAIRSSVFETVQFRPDLGRCEDYDLLNRLMENGGAGIYVPTALVHHRNSTERATEKYMRACCRGSGVAEVRLGKVPQDRLWFSAPLYVWRQWGTNALKYVLSRWREPASTWINAERKMAFAWGVILESRRLHKVNRPPSKQMP